VVPSDGRYNVRQGFALSMEFGHDVAWLCETAGPGGVRYLLTDQQGTTRVVTNEAGGVVSRHDELPFGEQVWAGAGQRTAGQGYGQTDGVRQQWALTEWEKATGLQHTWWRKYDPWAGRWTSPDPYQGSMNLGDPQSFNRYSYVENDPVNMVDPTGLYWAIDWGSCRAEVVSNGEGGLRFTGREICSLTWVPEGPQRREPFDIPGIRGALQRTVNKKDCAEFLKKLFDAMNKNNPKNTVNMGGNVMSLFEGVVGSKKGGLTREKTRGSRGYGGAEGSISKGNAVIFPGPGNPHFDAGTQLLHDTMGTLNELMHLSGSKGLYSDQQLAEAAHDVTGIAKLTDKITYPGDKSDPNYNSAKKDVNHQSWSNYFHGVLNQKCPIPPK
jgi:RHS repeat-associated protein